MTERDVVAAVATTADTVAHICFVDSFYVFCQSIFSDYKSQKEDSGGDTDTHKNAQTRIKKKHTKGPAESGTTAVLKHGS